MPLTPASPFPKSKGDSLRSEDWNQLVQEVQRLDTAKLDSSGDTIEGSLTVKGALAIGLDTPKAPLHISGGNWDVGGNEGDIKIGSDTHRLKIGVATGGGNAGDVRIRAQGGTSRLMLGAGNSDTLTIQNNNANFSGNLSISGNLSFGSQVRQMLNLWGTQYGIGVQSSTQYFRTDNYFAWYRGGSHNNSSFNAGGGVTQMVIRNDKVGIGTNNPQAKLDVIGGIYAGNSDIYFTNTEHNHTGTGNKTGWAAIENSKNYDALMILGRAGTSRGRYVRLWDFLQVNGDVEVTKQLGFGAQVRQMLNLYRTDYGIGIQSSTQYFRTGNYFAWYRGGTHNNSALNSGGGVTQMVIRNDRVGIGTNNPFRGKVEIVGNVRHQDPRGYSYFKKDPGRTTHIISTTTGYNAPYSLYADQFIGALEFNTFSDIRIKEVKGISNSESDLKTLLKLSITDYTYRDKITNDNKPHKKVIGQQVMEVFPQAVCTHTDVVPDIFQSASVNQGWVQLPKHGLKPGERVQILVENREPEIYIIREVTSDKFHVSLDRSGEVFVYGRQVDDFHVVDYDALSMLNISASQELYKIIERLKLEVKALKTQFNKFYYFEKHLATSNNGHHSKASISENSSSYSS